MKRLYFIFGLFFSFATYSAKSQTVYYRINGNKVALTASSNKSLIHFNNFIDVSDFAKINPSIDSIKSLISDQHLYVLYQNKSFDAARFRQQSELSRDVMSINPILLNDDGKEVGALSDQIIVRLKSSTYDAEFAEALQKYQAKIDRQTEYDSLTYLISSRSPVNNLSDLIENLYQTDIFEYVEPKMWLFIEPATSKQKNQISACTTDQYYLQQWGLNNTGQSGGLVDADIDAPEAWAVTTGSPNIRIAIVDSGVERNHPDLTANITGGFDATDGPGTCPLPGNLGNPDLCNEDFHGTMVAGIAAAVGCTGTGVTGVAYTSKIVPIRAWKNGYITNVDWVASAINHARNNAEIINLSFTMPSVFSTVETQINQAVSTGRGGKGAIVVASTGNDGWTTAVPYPGSNSNVVAVGNSTRMDMRAGDSNYGTGLDVVAPGSEVWTTDIAGPNGASAGDYVTGSATSYASPAVAGAFALILSVNPNLTYSQARMLLESTTDKISPGTYTYTATTTTQPNGSWHPEVGYGRINVNNTLTAMRNSNITGPSIICTSGSFNLTFKPNVPKTWYSSNTSILTINSVTGLATRIGSASGPVTITMRYSVLSTTYDITKEIWVGTPDVSTIKYDNGISAGGGNYVTPYSNHTVYLDQQNVIKANVTNTNWNPNPNVGYGYGMGFSQFDFSLTPGSTVVFNPVSSTNICGTANRSLSFTANSSFMLAPNPATTELKIMFDNVDQKEHIPALMTMINENTLQTVKSLTREDILKQENIKSTKIYIINVADLPRGTYYFQAKQDLNSNNETKSVRILLK